MSSGEYPPAYRFTRTACRTASVTDSWLAALRREGGGGWGVGGSLEGVAMPTATVTASFRPKVLAVLDAARSRRQY